MDNLNPVGLRVNYQLLDHDGVFLKVLRSQIEFAEKMVWRDCTDTMEAIFQFLVAISDDVKGRVSMKFKLPKVSLWTP